MSSFIESDDMNGLKHDVSESMAEIVKTPHLLVSGFLHSAPITLLNGLNEMVMALAPFHKEGIPANPLTGHRRLIQQPEHVLKLLNSQEKHEIQRKVMKSIQLSNIFEVIETPQALSVNGSPTNGHIPTRTGDPHDVNVVL